MIQLRTADRHLTDGQRVMVASIRESSNVHYPPDSSLLEITAIAGEVGARLRDRGRGVKLRVLDVVGGTRQGTAEPGAAYAAGLRRRASQRAVRWPSRNF